MIDRGFCQECFTVWWACRCPNRCTECGAGYRDNSSCFTPGCETGRHRYDDLVAYWEGRQREQEKRQEAERAAAPAIQCKAVEPAAVEPQPIDPVEAIPASIEAPPSVESVADPAEEVPLTYPGTAERPMARARRERRVARGALKGR